MEPPLFNTFISNFLVADIGQRNEVKRQSIVVQLLPEKEINPRDF